MLHIHSVQDFEIFQQTGGYADIPVCGTAVSEDRQLPNVLCLLLREEDGTLVTMPAVAPIQPDGSFQTVLHAPAGGHYTLLCELCGVIPDGDYAGAGDWPACGHEAIPAAAVFHIGVGEVFLIAGQSNASGTGKTPGFDPPHPLVHLCRNNGTWTTAAHPLNDPTQTAHPGNADFYLPGTSPFLRFATVLCRALGCPIGLLQAAKGDTYLGQWLPETDNGQIPLPAGYPAGSLWHVVTAVMHAAGGRIAGVVWMQGENDADIPAMCAAYPERFASFVRHVRTLAGNDALPFYTIQINKCTDGRTPAALWGRMKEHQRQAARTIPHVYVVPSHDLGMSDAVHNSTAAGGVIGERLAWSALDGEYGRPYFGKAPDIACAVREETESGMRIRVRLDNVVMGMVDYGCTAPLCRLYTANGEIPVKGAYCSGNTLYITPETAVTEPLRLDFAADPLPRVPVFPIDRATGMPILGAYGVPVTEK